MSVSKVTGQLLSNNILFQIQVSTEKLANIATIGSNHWRRMGLQNRFAFQKFLYASRNKKVTGP